MRLSNMHHPVTGKPVSMLDVNYLRQNKLCYNCSCFVGYLGWLECESKVSL